MTKTAFSFSFSFSLALVASLVVASVLSGCNTRSRGRVPTSDSSIRVDSGSGDASGDATVSDSSVPVDTSTPVDTGPGGACPLDFEGSMSGVLLTGSTLMGTNNQAGSCGGDSAPEVILRWTAPTTGLWTIDTIDSDFDTVLYVRAGSCSGAEVACNDDASGTQSSVEIMATAGEVFFLFADGFGSSSGNVLVRASLTGAP